jgi:cytochrome c oxidase assembly protein subunit 15
VLLAGIVVTGAAVRLTGSGLGCPTWPKCTGESFVTTPEMAGHGWIEFGNRLLTIVVGLGMLATPLVALRLRDKRRDLVLLSLGLWLGFLGQVVLGGLTVLFDLHPALVAGHFLVSMLLLLDVVVLDRRARQGPGEVRPLPGKELLLWLARLTAVVAAATLVLGTVVTGTGPHSGDEGEIARFGFDLQNVAQLHADAAMLLVGLTVALVFAVRLADASAEARRMSNLLVVSVVAQAGIGFAQYFTGVPVVLVELHVTGATVMWIFTLRLWLATAERPPAAPTPSPERDPLADQSGTTAADSEVAHVPTARSDTAGLDAPTGDDQVLTRTSAADR